MWLNERIFESGQLQGEKCRRINKNNKTYKESHDYHTVITGQKKKGGILFVISYRNNVTDAIYP